MTLEEILENIPKNQVIGDNFIRAYKIINDPKYKKIICSISGGADSDVMLDICIKCDNDKKIDYVWFDTGLEYQATKDHLEYLEKKYGIQIKRYKAQKPIPVSCKKYGQPFFSKRVSDMINRLQKHNFQWEDEPFDELYERYPRCKSALRWWCNENTGKLNISNINFLKEFLIENHPEFKIAQECCLYAKKNLAHKIIKDGKYDLNIVGIRKAEGGVRAAAYKNCFDEKEDCDIYRPLFWYSDKDKKEYEEHYGIIHSRCYTEYGLKRTGCAGCPFGRDFEFELDVIKMHEPKLYKAVINIFKESYEYSQKFKQFRKERKNR